MGFENGQVSRENRAEKIAQLQERIKSAKDHALDVHTEANFLQLYADLCIANKFPVPPDGFDPAELAQMEERVLNATARAESITEYRELLRLIPGMSEDDIADRIEHENAHANVAEQMETVDFKGYGITFFKDGDEIVNATPSVLTDRVEGADKVRFLLEDIKVLEAPREYGHKMTDDDVSERDRLQQIHDQHIAGLESGQASN